MLLKVYYGLFIKLIDMEIRIKGLSPQIIFKVTVPLYNNEHNLRIDGTINDLPCQLEINDLSIIHAKRIINQLNDYINGKRESTKKS